MALNKTVRNAITDSAINTDKIVFDDSLIDDDFASSSIGVAKTSLGVNGDLQLVHLRYLH